MTAKTQRGALNPSRLRRIELVRLITATQIVSLSAQTISNWISAGCPRNDDGTFSLAHVTAWLAAERRKKDVKGEDAEMLQGPDSPNLEEYRKWRAKNEQLDYERKTGELVAVEDIKREWATWGARLRTGLESVGKAHGQSVSNDIASFINQVFDEIEAKYGKKRKPRR